VNRRRALIGLALVGISGCATVPSTVRVEVPVPIYCEAPSVAAPVLPIDGLDPMATAFQTTRALWASLELLEAYTAQLRVAVDACRKPTPGGG
jgi:hypothetical protein